MKKEEVLVLGAGKMVEAILVGLKEHQDLSRFHVYSPSGVSAKKLADSVGARYVTDIGAVDPSWVLVGCKPQQIENLSQLLAGRFKDRLFVSVLAALSESIQMKSLGIKSLIRVMPNLPVRFGKGVSLISSVSAAAELPRFQQLFSRLGEALVVKEDELEELTLLTGSGPAFFYEFTQALASQFQSLDVPTRERLARAVLSGAAMNSEQEKASLGELIQAVTSKGGVTIATLENWRSQDLSGVLGSGVEAGKKRAEELRKTILRS